MSALRLVIAGKVQGVGFRRSAHRAARDIGGLLGWVRNLPDGTVEALVAGPRQKVDLFVEWARKGPGSPALVVSVTIERMGAEEPLPPFSIRF